MKRKESVCKEARANRENATKKGKRARSHKIHKGSRSRAPVPTVSVSLSLAWRVHSHPLASPARVGAGL